jgi:hypothetical protein
MQTVTTIGLDIAKSVFQVRDAAGQVVVRRQLDLQDGKSAALTPIRSACSDQSPKRWVLQNFCLASTTASLSLDASTSTMLWQTSHWRPFSPSMSFMNRTTNQDM